MLFKCVQQHVSFALVMHRIFAAITTWRQSKEVCSQPQQVSWEKHRKKNVSLSLCPFLSLRPVPFLLVVMVELTSLSA